MKRLFIRAAEFVIFICPLILFFGCTKKSVEARKTDLLGTVCSINAFDQGSKELYEKIFNRLEEIDSRFNVNIPTSDLSLVNDAAGEKAVSVHDDVAFVLERAIFYAEKTYGIFDPSVGPLVKLWGINTDHAKVPSQSEIDEALSLVDYTKIEITGDGNQKKVFLKQKGMSLDLGGIAKGYAADEVAKILSEEKINCAIIDLGGNIYVWGKKKNGAPWKIAVKNPLDENGEPALILTLNGNNTIVTSGIYERNFIQDGKIYHHILNPKTGFPADGQYMSTTIIADSSMDADALSTSAFLLGPEKYYALSDTPAIFISKDKTVICPQELIQNLKADEGFVLKAEEKMPN